MSLKTWWEQQVINMLLPDYCDWNWACLILANSEIGQQNSQAKHRSINLVTLWITSIKKKAVNYTQLPFHTIYSHCSSRLQHTDTARRIRCSTWADVRGQCAFVNLWDVAVMIMVIERNVTINQEHNNLEIKTKQKKDLVLWRDLPNTESTGKQQNHNRAPQIQL